MYRIFDSVSYGHMEPYVPFTLIKTFDTLGEATSFVKKQSVRHFIIGQDGSILNAWIGYIVRY